MKGIIKRIFSWYLYIVKRSNYQIKVSNQYCDVLLIILNIIDSILYLFLHWWIRKISSLLSLFQLPLPCSTPSTTPLPTTKLHLIPTSNNNLHILNWVGKPPESRNLIKSPKSNNTKNSCFLSSNIKAKWRSRQDRYRHVIKIIYPVGRR